jgi:hypothetical protein
MKELKKIFVFLYNLWADKYFELNCEEAFADFNVLTIFIWMQFWFVTVIPKYLNFVTVSKGLVAEVVLQFSL